MPTLGNNPFPASLQLALRTQYNAKTEEYSVGRSVAAFPGKIQWDTNPEPALMIPLYNTVLLPVLRTT